MRGDGASSPPKLVLILAPTGKSGTNFVLNALLRLGVVRLPSRDPLHREDHLLTGADLLEEYAVSTMRAWKKWGELDQRYRRGDDLLRALGIGLERFIGVGDLPAVAIKTPRCDNLRVGLRLFPSALFLVVVRDGRDVVESGVQAGYWATHEEAAEAWAGSVSSLRVQVESARDAQRRATHLVKYEDVFLDPAHALAPIVQALHGDLKKMDFAAVSDLPVYGSSQYGLQSDGSFRWSITPKTDEFCPIGRWRIWTQKTQKSVVGRLGGGLAWLGYSE